MDPIASARRSLAIQVATRGTTEELARAVKVLDATVYSPTCRHAITGITVEGAVVCQVCGVAL